MILAIPSYARSETLLKKTLSYLYQTNFPKQQIHVFVGDREQYQTYCKRVIEARQELLPPFVKGDYLPNIHIGAPTLRAQRDLGRRLFWGHDIVWMDDDISGLYRLTKDPRCSSRTDFELVTHLHELVVDAFILAKEHDVRLWGIQPTFNPFFMKKEPSFDLRYIPGGFYGVRDTDEPHPTTVLEEKEDVERTIRYYLQDGGVLRLNDIAMKTTAYTGRGGLSETRTVNRERKAVQWLVRAFPELCSLNESRRSEWAEVRLHDKRGRLRTGHRTGQRTGSRTGTQGG